MAPAEPDPRREAWLLLRWVRGAVGRFDLGSAGADGGGAGQARPAPRDAPSAGGTAPGAPDRGPESPQAASPGEGTGGDRPVAPGPEAAERAQALASLGGEAGACRRCRLCETRRTVVFGEGPTHPRLMVVGEAPGADEDACGRPFVGKAGQLLTRMLAAIGLTREEVYIANVLKCRPPENRPPGPDEVAACRPYLEEQMRRLDPALVLLLGNHAARAVMGGDRGISRIRGTIHTLPDGRRVLPTFHPAYLLRNPDAKRAAWQDLQTVARTLGIPVPGRGERSSPPGVGGSDA